MRSCVLCIKMVAGMSQLETEYQERLRKMQHVTDFSYGRSMLRMKEVRTGFTSPTYSLTRHLRNQVWPRTVVT
jgi:hypothetical protein